jgi:hypothetical protein
MKELKFYLRIKKKLPELQEEASDFLGEEACDFFGTAPGGRASGNAWQDWVIWFHLAARDLPGEFSVAWDRQGTLAQPFSRQSFFGKVAVCHPGRFSEKTTSGTSQVPNVPFPNWPAFGSRPKVALIAMAIGAELFQMP